MKNVLDVQDQPGHNLRHIYFMCFPMLDNLAYYYIKKKINKKKKNKKT